MILSVRNFLRIFRWFPKKIILLHSIEAGILLVSLKMFATDQYHENFFSHEEHVMGPLDH